MLPILILSALGFAPPENGLRQQFTVGEIFYETIDVRVTSLPEDDRQPPPMLHYTIELDTVTDQIDQATAAAQLTSSTRRLLVETSIGDKLSASYDTAERQVIGSLDQSRFDSDKLAELWSSYRGVTIQRSAGADGSLKLIDILGLPLDARDTPTTQAFQHSVASFLSVRLPSGPLDSWTDEIEWPTRNGNLRVLRLYSDAGRTESGLHKIDVSAAAVGADGQTRLEDPPLAARGTLTFDPARSRVTAVELVVEMKRPQLTRTKLSWQILPATELRDPLAAPSSTR